MRSQSGVDFIAQEDVAEEYVFDSKDAPAESDSDDSAGDDGEIGDGADSIADGGAAVDDGASGWETQPDFASDATMSFILHTDAVYSVHASPAGPGTAVGGRLVASGGGDDRAFIWRSDTGQRMAELKGHTDSVVAVRFSADGKLLATGGLDGRVVIWNVDDASEKAVCEGADEVQWMYWHPKVHAPLDMRLCHPSSADSCGRARRCLQARRTERCGSGIAPAR